MATNDLNTVTVLGRITRDIELKQAGQSKVANFSIASNRVYSVNGEKKEDVNFIDCEVWGKLAEILKDYGSKGKQVLVNGMLQQKRWEDPDHKTHSKLIIRIDKLQLLGNKPSQNGTTEQEEIPEMPIDDTAF